jgi:sodium/hydrogen exchanger 3
MSVLFLVFCIGMLAKKKNILLINNSIVATLVGVLLGVIVRFTPQANTFGAELTKVFTPQFFFLALLPPIIYSGGIQTKRKRFFANIGTIATMAIGGTLIAAIIVAGVLFAFSAGGVIDPALTLFECFLFGSLISATDPVAVLAFFQAIRVDEDLYAVLLGESILNDAAAIVLFETVAKFGEEEVTAGAVFYGVLDCMFIFTMSTLIGLAIALLNCLLFRFIDMREMLMFQVLLYVLFSIAPFMLAQGSGLSGVVATLFAAITTAHYTSYNMSHAANEAIHAIFEFISMVAETFIYLYIGLQVIAFDHEWSATVTIVALIIVLLSRCFNVFPIMTAANCCRTPDRKFRWGMQIVMWLSGLRGAIAFILALLVEDVTPNGSVIVSTTLIVCLVTTIAGGGAVLGSLKPLKLILPGNPGDHHEESAEDYAIAHATGFQKWDRRFLKPIFVRGYRERQREALAAQAEGGDKEKSDGHHSGDEHSDAHGVAVTAASAAASSSSSSSSDSDDSTSSESGAPAAASAAAGAPSGEFDVIPLQPMGTK